MKERKDKEQDEHDEEKLMEAREWDEWKDSKILHYNLFFFVDYRNKVYIHPLSLMIIK